MNALLHYICETEFFFMHEGKFKTQSQSVLQSMAEIIQLHLNVDARIHHMFPEFPEITLDAIRAFLAYDPRTNQPFVYF